MQIKQLMQDRPEDWLQYLTDELSIQANRAGDLVSLKYNQIESPMHLPAVQECRGIVVDTARRRVMAHPYNKFWNLGDAPAATIDWSTACVQEKLDGSLMILYWHDLENRWCVASSGTPDAGGPFGDHDSWTFADAFWHTFGMLGMQLPSKSASDVTFMFELCGSENRVVVRHEKPRLVLHGARSLVTGKEYTHAGLCGFGESFHWEVVKTYPIRNDQECLAAAAAVDPIAQEGYIVVDEQFNRVKVKSPRYVALHHMKGEATVRRAIELWQTGEAEELLSHFPEMGAVIRPVHAALDFASYAALLDWARLKGTGDRKAFAMAVKDKPWSATAFRLYGNGQGDLESAKAITRGLTLSSLERLVEQVTP